jgi:hypothetical protein
MITMAIKCACPNCDRIYTLADTMTGKTIRCKECEKTFTVADVDEGVMSADNARRNSSASVGAGSAHLGRDDDEGDRPRRRSKDRDEDDQEEGRRKKKQNGAPVGLIIGGIVGLLAVIAGVVVLIVLLAGGGKLTSENIAKLKEGMTESEVIALIGSPTQTIDPQAPGPLAGRPPSNARDMVWTNQKDITVTVSFENGKVSRLLVLDAGKIFAGDPRPPLGGAPNPQEPQPQPQPQPQQVPPILPNDKQVDPRLTKDNIRMLKPGMTAQELTNIIGPPTTISDFANVGNPRKKLFKWRNPAANINFSVWLTDDKADMIRFPK